MKYSIKLLFYSQLIKWWSVAAYKQEFTICDYRCRQIIIFQDHIYEKFNQVQCINIKNHEKISCHLDIIIYDHKNNIICSASSA